jgi:hypothetical protein
MNKKVECQLFDEIIYQWKEHSTVYYSKGDIVAIVDGKILADERSTRAIRVVDKIFTNLTQEKNKSEYKSKYKIKYKVLCSDITQEFLQNELNNLYEIISIQETKQFFIIKYKENG